MCRYFLSLSSCVTSSEGLNVVAQLEKSPPTMQETWVRSLGQEDPWRREWQPTPVFFLDNPWTEGPGGPQFMGSQRVRRG